MKLKKAFVVSGILMASLIAYKLHNFAVEHLKEQPISLTNSKNKSKGNPVYKDPALKRIYIFETGRLDIKELKNLLKFYKDKNDRAEKIIDETKIETILKPIIHEKLKALFFKQGWNFEELEGKVYYEVSGKNIDAYVVWKSSIYSKSYNYFDRFTIRL